MSASEATVRTSRKYSSSGAAFPRFHVPTNTFSEVSMSRRASLRHSRVPSMPQGVAISSRRPSYARASTRPRLLSIPPIVSGSERRFVRVRTRRAKGRHPFQIRIEPERNETHTRRIQDEMLGEDVDLGVSSLSWEGWAHQAMKKVGRNLRAWRRGRSEDVGGFTCTRTCVGCSSPRMPSIRSAIGSMRANLIRFSPIIHARRIFDCIEEGIRCSSIRGRIFEHERTTQSVHVECDAPQHQSCGGVESRSMPYVYERPTHAKCPCTDVSSPFQALRLWFDDCPWCV